MDSFSRAPTIPPEPVVFDPDVPLTLVTDLVGRYVIESRIGGGGVGVVYRARHAVLGRPVALKVLRPELSQDEGLLERLRREALSMRRVDSPHVVEALDYGRLSDGSAYLVMELLVGRDLSAELGAAGPLSWERARTIMLQICDAVAKAHAAGIVHRDLKPENVFLLDRPDGQDFVKVVDFGLAKVGGEIGITRAGAPLGTPAFMAPEQCAGDETDARTDVYALGVMLYEMLAGRLPFDYPTIAQVMLAHMEGSADPLRVHAPHAPEEVEAIVMRCLDKRPDARFRDAAALEAAIEAVGRPAQVAPVALAPAARAQLAERATEPKLAQEATQPKLAQQSEPHLAQHAEPKLAQHSEPKLAQHSEPKLAQRLEPKLAQRSEPKPSVREAEPPRAAVAPARPKRRASLGVAVALFAAAALCMLAIAATVVTSAWIALGGQGDASDAPATADRLLVTSDPIGARVSVDGQDRGVTPIVLPHPTGSEALRVRVSHPGYRSREVIVGARTADRVEVDLAPAPQQTGPAPRAPSIAPFRSQAQAIAQAPQAAFGAWAP